LRALLRYTHGIAMPEVLSASVAILGEHRPAPVATIEESRDARVLEIYAATLARSLNERNAFEAAVRLCRSDAPDLLEDDARKAVANIICRKP
jgi:hypothetical protein